MNVFSIHDFSGHSTESVKQFMDRYFQENASQNKIITHCTGGTGRTAFLLGALILR